MYDYGRALAIAKRTDMFVSRLICTESNMAGTSDEWADTAKRNLKAELARADIGYRELAQRLTDMGLPETEGSVQVKINRGTFPAWFMLAVMKAIGAHTVRLHEGE
jgi:hypothetical protein